MPDPARPHPSASPAGDPPDARDRSTVRSLVRALDLLEVIAAEPDGLRLVDIAAIADMPVSTAHRLLATLEERGFVHLDRGTKCWNVGARCLAVGAAFGRRRDLAGAASPVMQRLRDGSGQTVNLAVADARRLTLVHQSAARRPPPGLARLGAQSDIAATALGRSILAALPHRRIDALVDETAAAAPAAGLRAQLAETIRQTRARRYALDDEVNVAGLRCVAAPIFDEHAVPIGALSVVGAARGADALGTDAIAERVLRAAADVTAAIGGHAPGVWAVRGR